MDIVPIIKKNSGCDYHRLILPLKYMGIDVDSNSKLYPLLEGAKVVVYNRRTLFDYNLLLRARKQFGFKIVCDLDDYFELYHKHIEYNHWEKDNVKKKILESIFNADLVTVTTKRLADVVMKLNKQVEILPNALPFGDGQFTDEKEPIEKFQMVYAAGASHFWDLLSIKNLFYKIAREKIKKDLQVSLAGYNDGNEKSKQLWDAMESIITANKRLDYARKNSRPLDSYMDLYNTAHIAIAPLEGNYFNSFKSNLKILEAGCKNIPILVSNVPPYADEDCPYVTKCSSISDWYTSIERYIKDPIFTKETGLALGEYVREKYNLFKVNEKRKQIFDYLCSTY